MEKNKEIKEKNEEKKQIKISLKAFIVIVCLIVIVAAAVIIYNLNISQEHKCEEQKADYKDAHINKEQFILHDDKPIIYLYPEQETEVEVKLGNPEKLICSYPKYIDKWNVFAKPNGDLIDLDTNRNLYALYYESENIVEFKVEKEGFCIKGEDSIKFLEEKLEVLGLNEREAEEFIIYWLPKLESNNYNYIRFATSEEINKNMSLEINPKPDTTIRVLMIFKGLDKEIPVIEQKLEKQERNGFVAVEWGGTEIK